MPRTSGARKSETLNQYEKRLRKNIRQKIRRAEKRGYFFEDLPDISKASTKALEELQTDKIYEYGSYITEDKQIISGELGRKLERRASARKAALTRLKKAGKIPKEVTELNIKEAQQKINNLRERINSFYSPEYIKKRRKNKKSGKVYVYETKNNADTRSTIQILNQILDKAIAENGTDKLAEILDKNSAEIDDILKYLENYGINNDYEIGSYDHPRISALIRILIPRALTPDEIDEIYYAESSMEL